MKDRFVRMKNKGKQIMEEEYEIFDIENYEKAKNNMPNAAEISELAEFYKIMGDATRLRLLISLENGEFCATDLARLANMSRSAVSHQLKALRSAKLVKSRKEGKTVFYSLDDEHIHSVLKVALEHIQE